MRQIVAFGGGGFSMEPGNALLDDHVLRLTGVARPRVCFLPTASGDADHYVVRFYRAFSAARCEPSHVSLFRRPAPGDPVDVAEHLLAQDLIYVGGGSVVSLLGVWRAHGLDEVLRACWERGVVLAGVSAGALCWFADAITAFHGAPRPVAGLGLLPGAGCVHVDGEPGRLAAFRRLVDGGALAGGFAADDGAALHFVGDELAEVVTSRPRAKAYRVEPGACRPLPARYLGHLVAVAA